MAIDEQKRKEELAKLTGCLRCRCPGFQKMTRVECRGFNGVRFCYFACEDPAKPGLETRHPVGEELSCRCALGSKVNPTSVRFFENEEGPWGFAQCLKLGTGVTAEEEVREQPRKSAAAIWPIAIGIGGLLWYVTTQGR